MTQQKMKYSELGHGSFRLAALPDKGPFFKSVPWVSTDEEFKMIQFKPNVEIIAEIDGPEQLAASPPVAPKEKL